MYNREFRSRLSWLQRRCFEKNLLQGIYSRAHVVWVGTVTTCSSVSEKIVVAGLARPAVQCDCVVQRAVPGFFHSPLFLFVFFFFLEMKSIKHFVVGEKKNRRLGVLVAA